MITIDSTNRTVTITDGKDQSGAATVGWQGFLLQLGIDRAAKKTAEVGFLQLQLQAQNDLIHFTSDLVRRLLDPTKAPADPAKNQGAVLNITLTAKDKELIRGIKVSPPNATPTLDSYFKDLNAGTLVDGKSFNDFMTAMKNEVNQLTNQNQQEMIKYQSLINQRNQMTEWVASIMTMLATQTAQTITNLR